MARRLRVAWSTRATPPTSSCRAAMVKLTTRRACQSSSTASCNCCRPTTHALESASARCPRRHGVGRIMSCEVARGHGWLCTRLHRAGEAAKARERLRRSREAAAHRPGDRCGQVSSGAAFAACTRDRRRDVVVRRRRPEQARRHARGLVDRSRLEARDVHGRRRSRGGPGRRRLADDHRGCESTDRISREGHDDTSRQLRAPREVLVASIARAVSSGADGSGSALRSRQARLQESGVLRVTLRFQRLGCTSRIVGSGPTFAKISLGAKDQIPRFTKGRLFQVVGRQETPVSNVVVWQVDENESTIQILEPDRVDHSKLAESRVVLSPPESCLRR
jgi:hypothetical protein